MEANVSLQPQQLSSKQQKMIACLIAGNSIVDAARAVGIAEKTAHAWRKQPAFIEAYQTARAEADREVWQAAMQQLKNSVPQALEVLARHAGDEDVEITAASQLRAAVTLVEKAFQLVEIEEIKKRLAALEERLQ
jgi:hypothetical protein